MQFCIAKKKKTKDHDLRNEQNNKYEPQTSNILRSGRGLLLSCNLEKSFIYLNQLINPTLTACHESKHEPSVSCFNAYACVVSPDMTPRSGAGHCERDLFAMKSHYSTFK
jgi:hypothetical protein